MTREKLRRGQLAAVVVGLVLWCVILAVGLARDGAGAWLTTMVTGSAAAACAGVCAGLRIATP